MKPYLVSELLFFLFFISIGSHYNCKEKTPEVSHTTPQKTHSLQLPSDQGISADIVQRIIDECISIDVTFTDLGFTMNQHEKSAIINDLSFISSTPLAEIPKNCSPLGRKVYYSKEGVIIEADIYIVEACEILVFIRNEKPLFANILNQTGVDFYKSVLAQAKGVQLPQ